MTLHVPLSSLWLLLLLLGGLPTRLSHAEESTKQAGGAPLPPEIQHRVETLKTSYAEHVLQNALGPYEESLKTLNAKVRPALERAGNTLAGRKDLEGLVRIKSDITRIDQGEVLTATAAPPPEALKSIYSTYRLELGKLELTKKSVVTKARQRYDKGLQDIQDGLTSEQKVEAALEVKRLREEVARMEDEDLPQTLQPETQPASEVAQKVAAPVPAISLGADIPKKWSYHVDPDGSARGWLTLTGEGQAEFTGTVKNPTTGVWEKKVTQGTWAKGKKPNELIFTYPEYSWEVQIENGIGKMFSGLGTRYLKPVP